MVSWRSVSRKDQIKVRWESLIKLFTSKSICRSPVTIHQATSPTWSTTRHSPTVIIRLAVPWKSSILLGRLLVVTCHLMGLVRRAMVSANHYIFQVGKKQSIKAEYLCSHTYPLLTQRSKLWSTIVHINKCLPIWRKIICRIKCQAY